MADVDLYSYCDKYRQMKKIKGAENLENLSLKVAGIVKWTAIDPVKSQTTVQKDHQGRVTPQYGNKYIFTKSQSARKAESVIIDRGLVKGIYDSLKLPCNEALKTKFGNYISIDPGRQSFHHEDTIRLDHTFVYSGGNSGWTCTYSNDTLRYRFDCTVQCSGDVIFMIEGADQTNIADIVRTVEPHSNLLQGNVLSWRLTGEYSYSDVDEPIPL